MFFHEVILRQYRKNTQYPIVFLTGQYTPKSNFFCQENLTKSPKSLKNRDTYLSLLKMGKLDKLGRGLALAGALAAAEPALAEDQRPSVQLAGMTSGQVTDCVAFVKDQRALAAQNGTPMSRTAAMTMLGQCENGELEKIVAEQERIIAALREEIKTIQLEIDENGRIIAANGQAIAQIVAINGQLIIRRQALEEHISETEARIAALDADTEAKLREAERILQRLATS